MKKLLTTLMVVSFALVLSACGDPGDFESPDQNGIDQQDGGSDF